MSILEWIAHAKRANIETRGNESFFVSLYAYNLGYDLTRPTQLEVEENEWLFIGELSASKTGTKLLLLLRSRKEGGGGGKGALSEIKRVVNIPGYNNNLNVQNVLWKNSRPGWNLHPLSPLSWRVSFDGKSKRGWYIFANTTFVEWRRMFVKMAER